MAVNTPELNAFFPLGDLSPQGWLTDFITSQISINKKSVIYSMLYRSYEKLDDEQKTSIKSILQGKKSDGKNLLDYYISTNKSKFDSENKFIYVNGAFSDKLENNVMSKCVSAAADPTANKEYIKFLNSIKPYQLAFLQPYVKLYYGFKFDPADPFIFEEFPFSQKFDLESIMDPGSNAFLEGSGIKNISNNMQFNLGTKVNAQISISYFFSNMSILTKDIKTGLEESFGVNYPYGFSFQKLFANLGIKKEVLKLEYGYQVDETLTEQHGMTKNQCELINRFEKTSILLNKVGHNFRFTKEGSVEITVNYYNMIESNLESANTVMVPSPDNSGNARIIKSLLEEAPAVGGLLKDYYDLKKTSELLNEKITNISQTKFNEPTEVGQGSDQEIVNARDRRKVNIQFFSKKLKEVDKDLTLVKQNLSHYFKDLFLKKMRQNLDLFSISFNTKKQEDDNDIKYLVQADFNLIGFSGEEVPVAKIIDKIYSFSDLIKGSNPPPKVREKFKQISNRIFNSQSDKTQDDKKDGHIVFFPLRAVIRAAYEILPESDRNEIPSMLFGNFTCRSYNKNYYINTGNVLIEINYFQKWLFDKFYNKNSIDFSFGEFIKQLIDDLIPGALYRNRTHLQDSTRVTIQDYAPFYAINKTFPEKTGNLKSNLELDLKDADVNALTELIKYATADRDAYNPLVIWAKFDMPTVKEVTSTSFAVNSTKELNLNEEQDADLGIPHIIIGSDGGMFMDADFSQIDLKGLRTGIALQAVTDQNSSYFFYNYSLKTNVVASSIFKFGSIIAIPSPPLGLVGAKYDIGIVGYYKVKDMSVQIDPSNGIKTSITADWFYNPREGKHGNPHSSNTVTKIPQEQIRDHVLPETLDPINYLQLAIKKDINTVANFGIIDTKNESDKKDKSKKSQKPVSTPKDKKEKDI